MLITFSFLSSFRMRALSSSSVVFSAMSSFSWSDDAFAIVCCWSRSFFSKLMTSAMARTRWVATTNSGLEFHWWYLKKIFTVKWIVFFHRVRPNMTSRNFGYFLTLLPPSPCFFITEALVLLSQNTLSPSDCDVIYGRPHTPVFLEEGVSTHLLLWVFSSVSPNSFEISFWGKSTQICH